MANDTIPNDITNPNSLKNFLVRLTKTVDSIIGDVNTLEQVVPAEAAEPVSLATLSATTTELREDLDDLTERVDTLESNQSTLTGKVDALDFALIHEALGTLYNDFNDAAWGLLSGNGQFTALGSAMTNPPFAVVAGTTYTVYIESYQTADGGVVQRVLMEETGVTLTAHYRTGDSFAVAVTNGWIAL